MPANFIFQQIVYLANVYLVEEKGWPIRPLLAIHLPHKAGDVEQDEEHAATQEPSQQPGGPQSGDRPLVAVDAGTNE